MPHRGGGTGGGNRAPMPRDVIISKKISYVLRHGAEKEGLKLDRNGYTNCADLLRWRVLRSLNLTFPELQTLVTSNDKQRFQLVSIPDFVPVSSPSPPPDPDPAHYLIRASQGHSLAIASAALLTPLAPTDADLPAEVVHGTFPAAWKQILASGGLSRMGRRHVHFARRVPVVAGAKPAASSEVPMAHAGDEAERSGGALEDSIGEGAGEKVVSGMRADASVLVWVDVRRSMEGGALQWWRSANGVILTEGDERGMVPLGFVRRVERRGGEVLWRSGGE